MNDTNHPVISVLVPVYKVEPYIEQCVESLFSQTYKEAEYIFVDDCSPDGSIGLLEGLIARHPEVSSRVRIIRHTYNKGIGQTRQDLIDAAEGEYICFVDSDDYVSKDMLEKLVGQALRTGADIVEAGFQLKGCEHEVTFLPSTYRKKDCIRLKLYGKDYANLWGRLFRRSLFADHHIGFCSDICWAEDFAVYFPLMLSGSRTYIDDCVYFYRCNNSTSYTNNVTVESLRSEARAYEEVCRYYHECGAWGEYQHAIQMRILQLYRLAHQWHIDADRFSHCIEPYLTNPLIRLNMRLFRSGGHYRLANWLFRTQRRGCLIGLKMRNFRREALRGSV